MKITVVTSQYSVTGVPLAQKRLARGLAKKGHQVELVFGYAPAPDEVGETEGVTTTVWNCRRALFMLPSLIEHFRQKKPDLVFTAEDNTNAFVLLAAKLARSKAKISASSRIAPQGVYSRQPFSRGWIFKRFVGSVLGRADVWTCVSKDLALSYEELFPGHSFHGVYNILDDDVSRARMLEPVDHPWLNDDVRNVCITAGTLHERKGIHDLIRAIALLRDSGTDARLIVLGKGPQEAELRDMIVTLDLQDRVRLEGPVANPLKYFKRADIFVLASVREGMPNVLIEGILAGCTPVSTNCPTGPREILESGRYGYLVPMQDVEALADGIRSALENPIAPELLAEAIGPFHEDAVLAEHFRLLGL